MAEQESGQIEEIKTWHRAVELITPHIFRICTPSGSGSGCVIGMNRKQGRLALSTAAHVIDHAYEWDEPIRLEHYTSGKQVLATASKREIHLDPASDTALIKFDAEEIESPEKVITIVPEEKFLKVGNDIGWIGFPAVAPFIPCFFGGRISAWLGENDAYLVDGVAINGVSGGPAFHFTPKKVVMVGVVTAYVPNTSTGAILPGVSLVKGLRHFHSVIKQDRANQE